MKTDICKRCGASFNKVVNAQKYCSTKCAKNIKEKATKKKDKICPKCGKLFQGYDFGKKYCSKECSPIVRNRKHICQYCGIEYKPKHTTGKYCSYECALKSRQKYSRLNAEHRAKRKAVTDRLSCQRRRARKNGAIVKDINLAEIYLRNNYKCGICGRKVLMNKRKPNPLSPSLDHIVPLSLGGDHSNKNLQLTHLSCNISKRNNIKNGVQQWLF